MSIEPSNDRPRFPFEAADRCLVIGGLFQPVAIRDQMLRACLAVDRALARGWIAPDAPLLVVGAGAAGVTAALRATGRGVSAVLVERDVDPFATTRPCGTRLVEPALYDWPARHWDADIVRPPDAPPIPLRCQSGLPNAMARDWLVPFQRTRQSGLLRFRRLTEAIAIEREPGRLWADLRYRTAPGGPWGPVSRYPRPFGAIVDARGPGVERTWVRDEDRSPRYHGWPFWESDRFGSPNYGVSADSVPPAERRIVLSGSGDGALQDLLRLTLRNGDGSQPFSTREFLRDLRDCGHTASWQRRWQELEATILAAEERAARAFLWVPFDEVRGRYDEHADRLIVGELDRTYDAALTRLMHDSGLVARVRNLVTGRLRDDRLPIDVVYSGEYFARCYPVNRLLAHLLRRYFRLLRPRGAAPSVHFRPGFRVIAVVGQHHHCAGDWDRCYGLPHHVLLQGSEGTESVTYHLVVLRHGIMAPPTGSRQIGGLPDLA